MLSSLLPFRKVKNMICISGYIGWHKLHCLIVKQFSYLFKCDISVLSSSASSRASFRKRAGRYIPSWLNCPLEDSHPWLTPILRAALSPFKWWKAKELNIDSSSFSITTHISLHQPVSTRHNRRVQIAFTAAMSLISFRMKSLHWKLEWSGKLLRCHTMHQI